MELFNSNGTKYYKPDGVLKNGYRSSHCRLTTHDNYVDNEFGKHASEFNCYLNTINTNQLENGTLNNTFLKNVITEYFSDFNIKVIMYLADFGFLDCDIKHQFFENTVIYSIKCIIKHFFEIIHLCQ